MVGPLVIVATALIEKPAALRAARERLIACLRWHVEYGALPPPERHQCWEWGRLLTRVDVIWGDCVLQGPRRLRRR